MAPYFARLPCWSVRLAGLMLLLAETLCVTSDATGEPRYIPFPGGPRAYTAAVLEPATQSVWVFGGLGGAPAGSPFRELFGDLWIRFTADPGAATSFRIYDVAGRLRYEEEVPATGGFGGSEYVLGWDGRGDGGRRLPIGLYLVRIAARDRQATTKVFVH